MPLENGDWLLLLFAERLTRTFIVVLPVMRVVLPQVVPALTV
jgi:hypothetical protein